MIYKGEIFKNKKIITESLLEYGFIQDENFHILKKKIEDDAFELIIKIFDNNKIDLSVIEIVTSDEYNLVWAKSANGGFVSKIREDIENVLIDIEQKCCESDIFKTKQAKEIIQYIKEKYKTEPEYLWEKFPDNAIFRKKDKKGKWHCIILTIKGEKLGFASKKTMEITDLKAQPEEIETLIDNKKYFSAYHMNKKHWYTICLDDSIPIDEIKSRIDKSYILV